jgi:glycerol-3-phosphate dehydrogenase
MAVTNQAFDLVIIGGGISGIGVAMAAIQKGYTVAVVDQQRVLQATSKNSLRIIHGGFRYLQTLNILRTRESARAQDELLRTLPDFIKPLPCLMPLENRGLKHPIFAHAASILYQKLMPKGYRLPLPKVLSADFVHEEVPILENLSATKYLYWNDAVIQEPSYLGQYLVEQLITKGVKFIESTVVSKVKFSNGFFQIIGESGGNEKLILARACVNTTGPWMQKVLVEGGFKRITHDKWAAGYNVVLNKQFESKYAFSVQGPSGRMYFAVPRGKKTAIGTGYFRYPSDPGKVNVSELDLGKFLAGFGTALSLDAPITRADVDEVEVGVLPATSFDGSDVTLRGRHRVSYDRGFGEILSTKYTTFLVQGRELANQVYWHLGGA